MENATAMQMAISSAGRKMRLDDAARRLHDVAGRAERAGDEAQRHGQAQDDGADGDALAAVDEALHGLRAAAAPSRPRAANATSTASPNASAM
jgi:hypothetical protein